MEPIVEGASSGIGAAAGTVGGAEGGLGAAASAIGKLEGSLAPASEIGNIGKLNPETAGLVKGLEATLTRGTPDIGIKSIAEASVPDIAPSPIGTPEEPTISKPPSMEVPEIADQPAAVITGGENGIGPAAKPEEPEANEPKGELKPSTETEAQAPTQEIPKVPGKLASDPEYIKIVGEHYHELKKQGVEIDRAKIDQITEKSLSEYYDKGAKTQIEKGLPDDVKKDPLYQQKLGEAMTNAQDKGEALDANKLSQEALSKYQQEKDLQAEEAAGTQAEQSTTDQSLEDVAQRLSALLENNELKLESAKVTISAKDLVTLLKALAEGKEPDQKKKESMLAILLRILMIMGLSTFEEAGKQAEQDVTRRR